MEQKQLQCCKFLFLLKPQYGLSWNFPLMSQVTTDCSSMIEWDTSPVIKLHYHFLKLSIGL